MPVVSPFQEILPVNGIYRVSNVKVITEPGISSKVTIRAEDTFNLDLPDVQQYTQDGEIEFNL